MRWQVARRVGDEGHDVEHTQPGVDALRGGAGRVGSTAARASARAASATTSGRAGQGEDRTVVVGVAVQVEQGGAGGLGELAQDRVVPALADVDHALDDHSASVARAAVGPSAAQGQLATPPRARLRAGRR